MLFYSNKKTTLVSSTTFLGVIVDEKQSWNHHINPLCNTLSKNIGVLFRFNFIPQTVLKMLYHAFISSHFNIL